jgi:hypothetical protein
MVCGANAWIDDEVAGCRFADERLGKRLRKLLDQLAGAIGESIPLACQDWANTKAAYRFFSNERISDGDSNERISDGDILGGHFQSTRSRVTAIAGPILVLHDTTEFSYRRERADRVGLTCRVNSGKDKSGRFRMHTVCGLLMHASLAVTTDGLPLGLAAVKFWTRKKFKGTAALKRKINPTRIPIERKESVRWLENMRQSTGLFGDPGRCVHIGDRESDIYELFCLAQELGTHFLVRCCVDRLAGDGTHTVSDAMAEVRVQGRHHVEIRNGNGALGTAMVELSYHSLRILPPIGKRKRYPALTLTVLHAQERDEPVDRPRIDWRLITDLPVHSNGAAVEKLRWYAMRWKIEVVFTQMAKAHALAVGAERDDVADLDLVVGDQHAIDQQLHQPALPGEVGGGQAGLDPLAERRGRGRPAGELGPPVHLRLQLAGLHA